MISMENKRRWHGFYIGIILAFLPMGNAHALLERGKYSETEKAAFAFYTLAGLKPGFRDWVRDSEVYLKASEEDRPRIMDEQLVRLQEGFADFHPDEDFVRVGAMVPVKLPAISPDDLAGKYRDARPVMIMPPSDDDMIYFPFQIGETWISIVPTRQRQLQPLLVSNAGYEKIKSNLRFDASFGKRTMDGVYIEFYFRPRKAETKEPVKIGSLETWIMTGDIASIEIWDTRREIFLWGYSAPWFTSERAGELLDLYGKK